MCIRDRLGIVGVGLFLWALSSMLLRDTRAANARLRTLVVGSAIVVTLPLFASGNWDQSGSGWAMLALVSCLRVWLAGRGETGVDQSGRPTTREPARPATTRREPLSETAP